MSAIENLEVALAAVQLHGFDQAAASAAAPRLRRRNGRHDTGAPGTGGMAQQRRRCPDSARGWGRPQHDSKPEINYDV